MYFKVNRNKAGSSKIDIEVNNQYQFVCSGIISTNKNQTKKIYENKNDSNNHERKISKGENNYSSVIIINEDNMPKLDSNRFTYLKQRYSSNRNENTSIEHCATKRSNTSKIKQKRTSIFSNKGVKVIKQRKLDFSSNNKEIHDSNFKNRKPSVKPSKISITKSYRKTTYSSKMIKKFSKLRGIGGKYVYLGDSQDNSEDDLKALTTNSIDTSMNSLSK